MLERFYQSFILLMIVCVCTALGCSAKRTSSSTSTSNVNTLTDQEIDHLLDNFDELAILRLAKAELTSVQVASLVRTYLNDVQRSETAGVMLKAAVTSQRMVVEEVLKNLSDKDQAVCAKCILLLRDIARLTRPTGYPMREQDRVISALKSLVKDQRVVTTSDGTIRISDLARATLGVFPVAAVGIEMKLDDLVNMVCSTDDTVDVETRADARRSLISVGEQALPALIQCVSKTAPSRFSSPFLSQSPAVVIAEIGSKSPTEANRGIDQLCGVLCDSEVDLSVRRYVKGVFRYIAEEMDRPKFQRSELRLMLGAYADRIENCGRSLAATSTPGLLAFSTEHAELLQFGEELMRLAKTLRKLDSRGVVNE